MKFLIECQIKLTYIRSYADYQNGQAERASKYLDQQLRIATGENNSHQENWVVAVGRFALALNCTWNSTIGDIPHRVMYGKRPKN